mgnify:FL=1
MIREQRSREKLEAYYQRFRDEGELDVNVHPWVAEAWRASRRIGVPSMGTEPKRVLSAEDFCVLQKRHAPAIDCLLQLTEDVQEFFARYGLSLLLLDA